MEQAKISENEARIGQHVQYLRKLVQQDVELNSCLDDEFLVRFVRARKYDVELAAKQVRKFWEFRKKCPEIIEGLYPTNFRGVFEPIISIGKIRSERRHVLYARIGSSWDVNKVTMDDLFSIILLAYDHMASFEETQLNGIITLIDFSGLTWRHIINSTPKRLRQTTELIQGAIPARFKGFHFINNPGISNIFYAIIKPFLKQKMRDRFVFHGYNYKESIRNIFGADALPEFYGGNLLNDAYEDEEFFQNLYKLDQYYKTLMSYGFNRP